MITRHRAGLSGVGVIDRLVRITGGAQGTQSLYAHAPA
ncbi:hypothetical protein BJY54_002546 [Streptomyces nodosus]|nr:hypothetical protein [Streptomyces nodosus]